MSTRKNRRQLIESVFGDTEKTTPRERYETRDRDELLQLENLKRILTDLGHREPPESRRDYLWNRLEGRLDEAPAQRGFTGFFPIRTILVSATAIAAIAFTTIALLRINGPSPPLPETSARSTDVKIEDDERLDKLIYRATPLLMAVSNRSYDDQLQAIDITSEQRLATRLAGESRALREASGSTLTRKDRILVAELETVLMQVANTDPSAGSGEIALLRETIENRQLFFEFALRELRKTDAPPLPERSRDA